MMSTLAGTDRHVGTSQGGFNSWYQPHQDLSSRQDIAQEAYHSACQYVKTELRGYDDPKRLLDDKTTINEIKDVVDSLQKRYDVSQKHGKMRKWVRLFSSRIMYYGQVLDMLSQHHPEYVSLAWGTLKFVLTGILNHTKLVAELSKALAKIGDVLPQVKLSAELYPTLTMKNAISRLYAHIILFFQRAMKWYNMSPARKAIASIVQPFELHYQNTIDEVKLCAQMINDIAAIANHAELRDVHVNIQSLDQQLRERDSKLLEMQGQLIRMQEKLEISTGRILEVATCHKTLTERIHTEVLKVNPAIHDIQFSHILQVLSPPICPEEAFEKARSLAKRIQTLKVPSRNSVELMKSLRAWVSREESALFSVKVDARAEASAKEFAVDVVGLLQSMRCGVIWNFSRIKSSGDIPSMAGLVRTLLFQALRHDHTLLSRYPEELNITKFQSDHTDQEWITLLLHILSRLSKCYIVIEAEDIFQAHRSVPKWTDDFLGLFQELIDEATKSENRLKILVLDYGSTLTSSQDTPVQNRIESIIQRPQPVPPHLRRQYASRQNDSHLSSSRKLRSRF